LSGSDGRGAESFKEGLRGEDEGAVGQTEEQGQGDGGQEAVSVGPKEGQAKGQNAAQLIHGQILGLIKTSVEL
jgi:hypothetical protein